MALSFNPFTKKKKEDQIQGSGYTSAYASNPGNTTASMFANSLSQGKGMPSITGQSLTVPSFQQKQQQVQNIVGQANNKIQGSGYSSQYASNPSNYKATQTPQATQQTQQTQQSSVPSYITGYESLAEKQKALLDQQRKQGEDYYGKSYAERNRLLQESIPALQQQFIKTQGNIQKGIDSATQSAEYKKQNAQDQWGESQRLAAQTRQESEGRTRNKFAALGTTDSWGAGSYGQAQENVESDFNRFTQQGLRTKEQNMFEIDKALQDYEIEAQTTLDGLEASLENTVRQIQSDINMNNIEKQNALDSLFSDYQAKVLGVEEGMQGVYADYYKALDSAEANSLSFDDQGQPLNQVSYEWMLNNPDKFGSAFESGNVAEKQNLIGLVDQALTTNLGPVSGIGGAFGITTKFGEGLNTKALIDQIKGSLTLEAREKLKGQGQISDAETQMLANSVSKLQYGMTEDALKRELGEIKNVLEGKYRYAGQTQVDPNKYIVGR